MDDPVFNHKFNQDPIHRIVKTARGNEFVDVFSTIFTSCEDIARRARADMRKAELRRRGIFI